MKEKGNKNENKNCKTSKNDFCGNDHFNIDDDRNNYYNSNNTNNNIKYYNNHDNNSNDDDDDDDDDIFLVNPTASFRSKR